MLLYYFITPIICAIKYKNRREENSIQFNLKKKWGKRYPNRSIEWIKNRLDSDFSDLIWMSLIQLIQNFHVSKYIRLYCCCRTSNIYKLIVKDAVQSPRGATRNGNPFEKFLSLLLSDKSCLARSLIRTF